MQNLFELIPEDFFVLLTLKEKQVYIEALILIWDKYKTDVGELTKGNAITAVADYFGYSLINFNFEEQEQEAEERNLPNQARKIINKLLKYEWVKEYDDPKQYETFIEMPYYSSRIIEVIYNIMAPQSITSVNFASNVYLNIMSIGNGDEDEYLIYLENASRDTDNLVNFLSETFDNMKRYYNNLIKEMTVNGILKEHFEDYINEIVGQRFHKIITTENIFKYRQSIISKIDSIEFDNNILDKLVALEKDKHKMAIDIAEIEIFNILSKIKNCFEVVDAKIDKLRSIHHKYIKTSSERIQYLMQKEKNIKEAVFNVLQIFSHDAQIINGIVNDNVGINFMQSVTEQSLRKPYKLKGKGRFFPDLIEPVSSHDKDLKKINLLQTNRAKYALSKHYSEQSIMEFLDGLLNQTGEFNTKDFVLNGDKEFIKLVLAFNLAVKRKMKYSVERKDKYIEINGYVIPELIFRRIR